jgi:hypothetical protein
LTTARAAEAQASAELAAVTRELAGERVRTTAAVTQAAALSEQLKRADAVHTALDELKKV